MDVPASSAWTRQERFALLQLPGVLREGFAHPLPLKTAEPKLLLVVLVSFLLFLVPSLPRQVLRFVSVGFGSEKGV